MTILIAIVFVGEKELLHRVSQSRSRENTHAQADQIVDVNGLRSQAAGQHSEHDTGIKHTLFGSHFHFQPL